MGRVNELDDTGEVVAIVVSGAMGPRPAMMGEFDRAIFRNQVSEEISLSPRTQNNVAVSIELPPWRGFGESPVALKPLVHDFAIGLLN